MTTALGGRGGESPGPLSVLGNELVYQAVSLLVDRLYYLENFRTI